MKFRQKVKPFHMVVSKNAKKLPNGERGITMRPKIDEKIKRSIMIGVKVDKLTKEKIDYIADAAGEPTSTYVFNLITDCINQYTKMTKINWEEELNGVIEQS